VFIHENVSRLEVTVNDAHLVQVAESQAELHEHFHDPRLIDIHTVLLG
jgi:hypothetical protein